MRGLGTAAVVSVSKTSHLIKKEAGSLTCIISTCLFQTAWSVCSAVLPISLLVWRISLVFFSLFLLCCSFCWRLLRSLLYFQESTAAFSPEAFPFPRHVNSIQFPPWRWWTWRGPWPLLSHPLPWEDRASPTSAKGVQGSSSTNWGTEHPCSEKVTKGFPTPWPRWGLCSVHSRKKVFPW